MLRGGKEVAKPLTNMAMNNIYNGRGSNALMNVEVTVEWVDMAVVCMATVCSDFNISFVLQQIRCYFYAT